MLKRWITVVVVSGACAACEHGAQLRHGGEHGDSHTSEGDSYEAAEAGDAHAIPTDPATVAAATRVRVLSTERLPCATEALGIVDVHERVNNQEAALDILRRRAAARGAEAVTGVEFRHGEGGPAKTHLSGMAVRCRDLLRGRKYDVIEHMVIDDRMGREDAAFARLKAAANALGANLVIDVKFVHGEAGTGGVRVSGTAVRASENEAAAGSRAAPSNQ